MTRKYSHILVTGSAGFIGSHVTNRLLEDGFDVTVVDNLSSGHLENINAYMGRRNFHFIKGNIRD